MQKVIKRHEFMEQFRNSNIQFLTGFKKSVLIVASIIADHLPNPFPSYTKIMKDGFIKNRNTVANAIKFLKEYGFIKVNKLGKNNHYHLFKIDISNIQTNIKNDTNKLLISNKGVKMINANNIHQYQLNDTNSKKFSQNNEYQNTSISTKFDTRTSINSDTLSINTSINTKVPNSERNTYLSNQYYSIKINTNTDTNKKIDTSFNNDTHTLIDTIHNLCLKIENLNTKIETLTKTNNARIDKLGLRQNEMNSLVTTIERNVSFIMSNQTKQQKQMINLAPALASRLSIENQTTITDIDVAEFMPSMGSISLLKQYFNTNDEQAYQQIQAFRCYVKDKLTDPNHKINNLQTYFERAVTGKWACLEIREEANKSFKQQDREYAQKCKGFVIDMSGVAEELERREKERNIKNNINNNFIDFDEEIPTTSEILSKRENFAQEFKSIGSILGNIVNNKEIAYA